MKTPKSNKASNPKNQSKPQKHPNNNHKIKYPHYYSNTHKIPPILELEKKAYINFKNLYINDENFYNIKTINEIICNESSHIVALFKDYLIYGDYSEFLQGSYSLGESRDILPKIYEYYESCSVIFPNYIILPESKYIYKNIQRKQRIIDNQQEIEQEEELRKREEKNNAHKEEESNVFDTQAVDSILNQTDTSTIRMMMGMTKEVIQKDSIDDDNKTTSYEKIIDLINQAEFWSQEHTDRKKVNCALRLKHNKIIQKNSISNKSKSKSKISNSSNINNSHAVKGRNYNRISNANMSSINKMNSTTEKDAKAKVKTTIRNIQNNNDKETQTFYNNVTTKNKVNHRHNNSHNVKKGIIHSLLSSNIDLIRKTFKELAKKNSYRNSTKINPVTSPNNERVYKQTGNKLISSISSPKSNLRPSSHSKSTISMTKLSGQIFGFISKYKSKKSSKVNHSKNSKDCDKKITNKPDLLFISHNIPLTSRDQTKNSMNQDIMTFLDPKQEKEKHVKNSMSISHKKTFTSSSLGTATGSLNNNFQQNEEKITVTNKTNINSQKTQTTTVTHRNERNSFNYLDDLLTKTGGGKSQTSTQSGKMKNCKIISKFGSNSNTNSKVLKTYTHYQSNSSLTGEKSKDKKQPNAVIPIRKELNIKGIKIKGFDELLSKNYYSHRNNNSHSDRVKIGFINNSDSSSKRTKNKTCIPNTPFNKGYYEVSKTTAKK